MRAKTVRLAVAIIAVIAFVWTTVERTNAKQFGVPVVIVGGSAAAGWHDETGQGYIVRALDRLQQNDRVTFAIDNQAIPGSRVTNPAVKANFPVWMKDTEGGVAIIGWGYLNDIRLSTPPPLIFSTIRQEIKDALKTHHTVIVTSPPATEPTFTFDKVQEHGIWNHVAAVAHSFHSSHVFVLNIMDTEIRYLSRHHQSYTQYMDGEWDPNTAGHILAAHIFIQEARRYSLRLW